MTAKKSGLARRRLMQGGLGVTAGTLAAAAAPSARADGAAPPVVPEWTRTEGAPLLTPPYGVPSRYEKDVIRRVRAMPSIPGIGGSLTPLMDLHGIITPGGLHYERHHDGVPTIDSAQHRLLVHGMVERPLVFGMDDLMRFPSVSRIHFLECSGNSPLWRGIPPDLTVQMTHGLLSCSEWTGVRLADVLAEVGLKPGVRWVLAEGADGAALTRSIPLGKALADALLVYAQNGERLRPEQGYPLRLLLPGFEGNMNVKWLRRLKLGQQAWETREETSRYTDLLPDGTARQFAFVMEVKSVVTRPSAGCVLRERGPHEITGLAWSGGGSIRTVEVTTDGGATWHRAGLQDPILPKCLTRFRLPWRWDGSPAKLASRATDDAGNVQPTRDALLAARGNRSQYHYNAIHTWQVTSDGSVRNAA